MSEVEQKNIDLARRIYELDGEVYATSGSELGRTFSGDRQKTITQLATLIQMNPQGHILRDSMAAIGNMARSITEKSERRKYLIAYDAILREINQVKMSNPSTDIADRDLARLNAFNRKNVSSDDHLIICISRSHGSAGTEIGFALAEELHINFYEESILDDMVQKRLENEWGEEELNKRRLVYNHGLSKQDAAFFRQSELICELAQNEDMVIMGRAADAILKGKMIPHISIFITAPLSARTNRIMEVNGVDTRQALRLATQTDLKHRNYYHEYTGKPWGDANNYDMCINSACYGIEEAVELIKRLVDQTVSKN